MQHGRDNQNKANISENKRQLKNSPAAKLLRSLTFVTTSEAKNKDFKIVIQNNQMS